ncbi:MAG: molybdopterin molybdotransferase MoeA [Dethiobacter sp.]|jgi:molybdopterin molybdotransferase|nr:molybdopterin molybdotransferase MoeA [Dethiobacter sp.]MBS3990339.1 molybdopterin molybdotransferase MoeA [Dethiobacter sp.]
MISYDDAVKLILSIAGPSQSVQKPLQEALGYALARNIYAALDQPPFHRSPLDGFAFRAADTAGAQPHSPTEFNVIGYIPAGTVFDTPLKQGEAVRIFTGAMLPLGADAVAAQEKVFYHDNSLFLERQYSVGENVARAGEDVLCGSLLLTAGSLLGPAELGLIASQGISDLPVYPRPRVAILTFGSELLEISDSLSVGKIYNSNRYLLEALVSRTGAIPDYRGKISDERDELAQAIVWACQEADFVLTTGGVSVGDHDLTPAAVAASGAEILFHRVAIKPGTPALAARFGNKIIFSLSGNPAAALVTFLQFVLPALQLARGIDWRQQVVKAVITKSFPRKKDQTRFLAANTIFSGGRFVSEPQSIQKSGVISSFRGVNSLIIVPPGLGELAADSMADVQLFPQIFDNLPFTGREQ